MHPREAPDGSTALRTERVSVNGASLWCETRGAGPHVVLVHAGIADSRMWEPQVAPLARAGFTVVRADLRGFGRSPMVAGPYRHADDVRALLDRLGIERAVLVGCSRGARSVLDLVLEAPERALAVVLVAPSVSGFVWTGENPPQVAAIEEAEAKGDLEEVNRLEVEMWVAGPRRAPARVDPAVLALARDMNRKALGAPAIGEERPPLEPAAARLAGLAKPVLIVTGADDVPRTLAAARHLAAAVTGASAVEIADAAHLPGLERPEAFNAALLRFLARHGLPETATAAR